jgi:hypothetical protein
MLAAPLAALDRPLKAVIWTARPVGASSARFTRRTSARHWLTDDLTDQIASIDTITAAVVP